MLLPSLRIATIRFHVQGIGFYEYQSHVVENDAPILRGLRLKRELKAINLENDEGSEFLKFTNLFRLPLTFKRGHLFHVFPEHEDLFTDTELYKLQ